MRRVKRIVAKDAFTKVKVTVEIESKRGWRSRETMDKFSSGMASGIMSQLAGNHHLSTTLDKIKVG